MSDYPHPSYSTGGKGQTLQEEAVYKPFVFSTLLPLPVKASLSAGEGSGVRL
jgi:hypothetical protein